MALKFTRSRDQIVRANMNMKVRIGLSELTFAAAVIIFKEADSVYPTLAECTQLAEKLSRGQVEAEMRELLYWYGMGYTGAWTLPDEAMSAAKTAVCRIFEEVA